MLTGDRSTTARVSPYSVTRRLFTSTHTRATALLLALVFVVSACATEEPTPATPNGAVIIYMRSIESGDTDAAYARLAQAVQSECSRDAFTERALAAQSELRSSRVTIREVRESGESAVVVTNVDRDRGGSIFPGGSGFEGTYSLRSEDGEWHLTEPGWPIYFCETANGSVPRVPAIKLTPAQ